MQAEGRKKEGGRWHPSSKLGIFRKGEKPSFSLGGGDLKAKTLTAFEEQSLGVVNVISYKLLNGTGNKFPVFERKVSRSRSVGFGTRSFSRDFFERISTWFGDFFERISAPSPASSYWVSSSTNAVHHHYPTASTNIIRFPKNHWLSPMAETPGLGAGTV
ncbi:hypothetical protein CDL15_Pgr007961 [Punica granatum]|uniref:Uncharacterized protein n=1 Tax=Punica granatum TaxID=22663 RepID=A0A218XC38_PUNGR|nr:hypothetical protein CDL15_Pgr007961 [Punica granatum]